MLLSYTELCNLVDDGVIEGVDYNDINATSIDLTLGAHIRVESLNAHGCGVVDLSSRSAPEMSVRILSDEGGYKMRPGEFILAHTEQVFNLPNDVSAEFKLKSSLARAGLQHALAGWCDAGWHGSNLTLELSNSLREHILYIRAGMKIGQMVFYRHHPVPDHASYANRGQYNKDTGAVGNKGVR